MSTDCGEKFENPDSFHVVYMGDEKIIFDLEEFGYSHQDGQH
jgi:hypothetical protein